ncbi:TPA: hypothetical protein ACF35N_004602 [Vibrio parahaemolyticus]|nr:MULTISPECIES: hypothetical protein [Vibrio]ELB2095411.1 hypothetical protein [Vibrio parahaemolyticus]ELB2127400.1 hypothetical protein [Vibrio parahaemolyticus]MBE4309473.1 hypothetical protein [Vibrio parahaemolyticus]MCS0205521.1 hypothetical protein [Vibrio sp. HS-50-1]MCS0395381.1 hypothetical protein [Vibrio diabolicus]
MVSKCCPTKENDEIEIEEICEITPHTKAVMQAGEVSLVNSIETSREFCKSMITISFSSIPIYLALLKVYTKDGANIPEIFGWSWSLPVILALLSATCALIGYLPGKKLISLDLPDEVERFLSDAATSRFYAGVLSFLCLGVSILYASWVIVSQDV